MPVFDNADDLVKHVITKTWNNGVTYTPKEAGFPNNTPNASKKKTALTSLFAVKITDEDRREKYERGIGGAIVDKIIDDALKNGFVITGWTPLRSLIRLSRRSSPGWGRLESLQ